MNTEYDRLDGLLAPVEPGQRYCTRCGMEIPMQRQYEQCASCEGTGKCHPRGAMGKSLPPFNPAFEVHVHFDGRPKQDRTIATLEALNIPYVLYYTARDPLEVSWARGLFNPELAPKWPILIITSHGEVTDFWEGYDLNRLNALPTKRAAAISPTDAHISVPDTQEEAA